MPESKNSSRSDGYKAEECVKNFFLNKGYIFVGANLLFYFAEVDLLFVSPQDELVLIEVKSIKQNCDLAFRPPVSAAQTMRLKRVFQHLIECSGKSARADLAAVNQDDQVFIFSNFLAD